MVGSVNQGIRGEEIQVGGETVANIRDSVIGNYEISTAEGTFTAMDNVYGGESLYHFGEAVAVSRPGLFGQENWYDAGTNELLASTGVNSFGQTTIDIPSSFISNSYDPFTGLDHLSYGSDIADIGNAFADSAGFLVFLDFI